jgi:hypothetical protein
MKRFTRYIKFLSEQAEKCSLLKYFLVKINLKLHYFLVKYWLGCIDFQSQMKFEIMKI